ncbi:MAG TPA: hypothetical protein VFC07_11675 [Verrucomicrobiae bacterium]|nr:hypothetical protein [Verrucomicrobiae bacterium]
MKDLNAGATPALPGMSDLAGNVYGFNYCYDLPPVHPKCRVFDNAKLMARWNQLVAVGLFDQANKLAAAMRRVLSQPRQGAWHYVAPGWVGQTHIIPLMRLQRLSTEEIGKLGICGSAESWKQRRLN